MCIGGRDVCEGIITAFIRNSDKMRDQFELGLPVTRLRFERGTATTITVDAKNELLHNE
jgi:hypothetical protein